MSTATAFKYYKPFPFCVEQKTEAEIDAIAGSGTTQVYLRWKGTLAQLMDLFWNTETVSTTIYNYGSSHSVTNEPWMEFAFDSPQVTIEPSERVCFSGYGAASDLDVFGAYFAVSAYVFFYNTSTGDYEALLSVFFNTSGFFNSDYDLGLGYTDPFTVDVFGQTFTLYSTSAADIYCDDIVAAYYTY